MSAGGLVTGRRSFDQGAYWRQRGIGYRAEFDHHPEESQAFFAQQEAAVRALLGEGRFRDVRSVLEIGAGFGRVTSLVLRGLPQVERYLALDISAHQIAAARAQLEQDVVETPEFRVADFREFPEAEQFDLVIASEVFLHFPPKEITGVVRKAQRLSRRLLVHLDPFPGRPQPPLLVGLLHRAQRLRGSTPGRTDWLHNFPRLYDHTIVREAALRPIAGGHQHLFIVERSENGEA